MVLVVVANEGGASFMFLTQLLIDHRRRRRPGSAELSRMMWALVVVLVAIVNVDVDLLCVFFDSSLR